MDRGNYSRKCKTGTHCCAYSPPALLQQLVVISICGIIPVKQYTSKDRPTKFCPSQIICTHIYQTHLKLAVRLPVDTLALLRKDPDVLCMTNGDGDEPLRTT